MSSPTDAARIVEDFVTRWLRGTEFGRDVIAKYGFEIAMEHIFELLNAGYLKIASKNDELIDIRPCMPPQPPSKSLDRPR